MAREILDSKNADCAADVASADHTGTTPQPNRVAGLNSTPSASRVHISFFGRRNAGKSSLVNAVTGQSLSIVSDTPGTTTDPVSKAMELLPLGPVIITDTAGLDDEGLVGEMRVQKAMTILRKTDIAVLVVDSSQGIFPFDSQLMELFKSKKIPYVVVANKSDLRVTGTRNPRTTNAIPGGSTSDGAENAEVIPVSALTGAGVNQLKETLASMGKKIAVDKKIIMDRLKPSDVIILVTPIDSSAPKGRMILPQVQTIRDILDGHGVCIVTQVEELSMCLGALKEPPALVITDSQAFNTVKKTIPESVKLTSFSILFARLKGILDTAVSGAEHLADLNDGDKVLISEGCTHHRQCEDIGTVKLPAWIEKFTGKKLNFSFTSGGEFPEGDALKDYSLIVHCGGCMLNEREMVSRMELAEASDVEFTNYGILIAHMNGILERSIEILIFTVLGRPQ